MKKVLFFVLISMLILLSGCSVNISGLSARPCSNDPAEIAAYALPSSVIDKDELCIPANLSSSAVFADCSGDGSDELIVCTCEEDADSWYVTLNVFSLYKDGYRSIYSEKCEGKKINRLEFAHLDDGTAAIVFEYCLTDSGLHEVLICSFFEGYPCTAYKSVCDGLAVFDIDNNGVDDILIADASSDDECGELRLLQYKKGSFEITSTAPISAGLERIESIVTGNIGFRLSAVLCEGYIKGKGYITDCIICENGALRNIFIEKGDTVSSETLRPVCIWSKDIDGDGCIEIPCPRSTDGSESRGHWFINWLRPSADGECGIICTTYNDFSSGWYLIIPDNARQNIISEITLDSDDIKCTLFRSVNADGEAGDSEWAVYEFIGNSQCKRLEDSGFEIAAASYGRAYSVRVYNRSSYSDDSIASGLFISDEHINDYRDNS